MDQIWLYLALTHYYVKKGNNNNNNGNCLSLATICDLSLLNVLNKSH